MSKRLYFLTNEKDWINPSKLEISYILGLLWADGCIWKNEISLVIKTDDFENFYRIFNLTGNWGGHHRLKFLKKTNKYYKSSKIFISSKIVMNFLLENDYDKKSYISPHKILDKLPKELHNHFFRGYIDGDGSFSSYGKNQIKFNITSTIEQDWSSIIELFKNIDIKIFKIYKYDRKSGKSSLISISNKYDIIKIGEFIYINSDNIRLDRKYLKYKEIRDTDRIIIALWTEAEIQFLKENHKKGLVYCTNKLNRTKSAIRYKKSKLKQMLLI